MSETWAEFVAMKGAADVIADRRVGELALRHCNRRIRDRGIWDRG